MGQAGPPRPQSAVTSKSCPVPAVRPGWPGEERAKKGAPSPVVASSAALCTNPRAGWLQEVWSGCAPGCAALPLL